MPVDGQAARNGPQPVTPAGPDHGLRTSPESRRAVSAMCAFLGNHVDMPNVQREAEQLPKSGIARQHLA
jgi:hypothetical protein